MRHPRVAACEVGTLVTPLFYLPQPRFFRMDDALEREIEDRVEALGFELVELERAGSGGRPILRLRIDRPDAEAGVSLADCAAVSRDLEKALDDRDGLSPRYVLEVSSPGVERPLVRRRDFERFRGSEILVHAHQVVHEGSRKVEGELLGIEGDEPDEQVRIRTAAAELSIPRRSIKRAHLVFRWGGEGKKP